MAIDPSDFYGGPNVYNPAMGMLLVQHPELVASHLASLGHEPPGDVSGTPDHVQAKQSLGHALAFNTKQGNVFAPGEQIMPFASEPPPALFPSPTAVEHGEIPGRPTENPAAPPTPAPESSAATGAVPAPNTQATPGQDIPLPRPRPDSASAEAQGEDDGTSTTPSTAQGGEKKPPLDDLALALAGIKGMPYSNPLHIYSPQAPHPSNMISRSNVPQTLMQELAAAGHPAGTFRLGEALGGRRMS